MVFYRFIVKSDYSTKFRSQKRKPTKSGDSWLGVTPQKKTTATRKAQKKAKNWTLTLKQLKHSFEKLFLKCYLVNFQASAKEYNQSFYF